MTVKCHLSVDRKGSRIHCLPSLLSCDQRESEERRKRKKMGKIKKKKSKKNKLKVAPYEAFSAMVDGDDEEIVQDTKKETTRGHILQRHKIEYKEMRNKIKELKTRK